MKKSKAIQHTLFCNNRPATPKPVLWSFWISHKITQYENRESTGVGKMAAYITQLQATNLAGDISHLAPLWLSLQGKRESPEKGSSGHLSKAFGRSWAIILPPNQPQHSINREQHEYISSTIFFFKSLTVKDYKSVKHSILGQFPTWVTLSSLSISPLF